MKIQSVLLVVLGLAIPAHSAAQGPAAVVEIAGGSLAFPDDSVVREGMVGGAARMYLTRRMSVGPEVTYIDGRGHRHLMMTGNVTWDLRAAPARVVPFLTGGGGWFQTSQQLVRGGFTSYDPAFTAGGGMRAETGRLVFGGEVRLGWELHLRTSGFVGLRLFG